MRDYVFPGLLLLALPVWAWFYWGNGVDKHGDPVQLRGTSRLIAYGVTLLFFSLPWFLYLLTFVPLVREYLKVRGPAGSRPVLGVDQEGVTLYLRDVFLPWSMMDNVILTNVRLVGRGPRTAMPGNRRRTLVFTPDEEHLRPFQRGGEASRWSNKQAMGAFGSPYLVQAARLNASPEEVLREIEGWHRVRVIRNLD